MLQRTHLAITVFLILLFWSSVNNSWALVLVSVIATYLPDIDSRYSRLGHRRIARVLQWFTKHRGMIHSFTFLLSVTVILVLFWPVVAFSFFLGYGSHLVADSFTKDGIRPFYPSKKKAKGFVKTGGRIEVGILVGFIIANLGLFFVRLGVF
jgi:membrane-bound metal-dependent hydrolase YbcI (DUF457 family)